MTLLARLVSAQGVHHILAPSDDQATVAGLAAAAVCLHHSSVSRLSSRCDKSEEGLILFVWTTTSREGRKKNREKPRNVRQNTIKRPSLNSSYTPPSLEPEREGWAALHCRHDNKALAPPTFNSLISSQASLAAF